MSIAATMPAAVVKHFALLDLPTELRLRILKYATYQNQHGTIEIQTPVWTIRDKYDGAVFAVCRSLRDEALEAYYNTNFFLWNVSVDDSRRSDPCDYPQAWQQQQGSMTSATPWRYPLLFKHLRHLYLNMWFPKQSDKKAWLTTLPAQLDKVLRVLDCGKQLFTLHVNLTTNFFPEPAVLNKRGKTALKVLSRFEVKGSVTLSMSFHCNNCRRDIRALGLASKMQATTHSGSSGDGMSANSQEADNYHGNKFGRAGPVSWPFNQ